MTLSLGYLGFEVKDLGAWESFATRVLGLSISRKLDDGGLALRMDAHEQRILVRPGTANDLFCVGWQAADAAAVEGYAAKLRAAGVEVTDATGEELSLRRVARCIRFRDPAGNPVEICCGPALASEPFRSDLVRSGFVTGDEGLGHLVLGARNLAASQSFYCDLLGFRLSDRITCEVYGYPVDIVFLHVNTRHHSLALGEGQKKHIHHFMLEVLGMDDVGLAFDRAARAGCRIMQTLGKHPNDRMFSFYARTPGGFEFEIGWGGRKVDDATWTPGSYDHISEWGHHPPQFLVPERRAAPSEGKGPAPALGAAREQTEGKIK